VWLCSGCKTESFATGFEVHLLRWGPNPEMSSKFDQNSFLSYWLKMTRTVHQTTWVWFGCKTNSSRARFQLCLLRWCPYLEKWSKFDRNIFSDVMAGNDKNCIPNCQLETYSGGFRTRKVRLKHFSVALTKKYKNCTQTVWVQNPIFNFACSEPIPVIPKAEKVFKIGPKFF